MNQSDLEELLRQSLDNFYQRRLKKLSELKLREVLRKKNPYLFRAISVKSGPNIFNSSQSEKQDQEFKSLRSRLLKLHKQFDPILGHAYGRKFANPTKDRTYRIRSGQALWEELTGDPDFYLKIISLMRDYPQQHRLKFEEEWDKALNRFEYDFLMNFGNPDGSINWEQLLRYNSGKEKVVWVSTVVPDTVIEDQEDESDLTKEE